MSETPRNIHEIADEYVLGLLDAANHARVESEIETDADLQAAIAASRDRFLALDMLARPVDRPDTLWERISSGLEEKPSGAAAGSRRSSTNDNADSGWVGNGWRITALAGMAASLLLAVGLGWSLLSQPEPRVIAVLLNTEGEPLVLVEDFGNASARITPLANFDVPEGRTMQVWTLPSKEMGPVSLGLLPRSEAIILDSPALPQPHEAQLYEITIEQAGGSPTGRPTGPILVKGFARMPR